MVRLGGSLNIPFRKNPRARGNGLPAWSSIEANAVAKVKGRVREISRPTGNTVVASENEEKIFFDNKLYFIPS
jgi:hypothetical protein